MACLRVHVSTCTIYREISILADRFSFASLVAVVSRISNSFSHSGVCCARTSGVSDREAETRGARSPRSRSRLEITPFHPYLRGERVSRKGASGIAWSRRDENIPLEIPGSAKIERSRLEKDCTCLPT